MALVDHVDLVVSSIARSLAFYRGLLGQLGTVEVSEVVGERGETIHYLSAGGQSVHLGLRERPGDADKRQVDRYALGLHHLALRAPDRPTIDAAAGWLRDQEAEIEDGPREWPYTAGYYAVFFYDPDGLKLELVHYPR
jgi:glyoxylase I family protein